MLRIFNYDIVCQEIPDEITLALNISECPIACKGCHSPWLQGDNGERLTDDLLLRIIAKYDEAVTCICFMGGDSDPTEIERLAGVVKTAYGDKLCMGWYSGKDAIPEEINRKLFKYIKIGPYIESKGGLKSPNTNQKLYIIDNENNMVNITNKMQRHG